MKTNLTNQTRKAVYQRDGYACALCNDPRRLQIHHAVPRSQGGSNDPQNLITLCPICHAVAHGTRFYDIGLDKETVEQSIVEYLADLYVDRLGMPWHPWEDQED